MPSKRAKNSHEDCLELVCVFCRKKTKGRIVSESQKTLISEKLFEDYKRYEQILQKGVCENCNRIANDVIKNHEKAKRKFTNTQDFEEAVERLQNIPPRTRSSQICSCFNCEITRSNCINLKKAEPEKIEKKCPNCYGIIKPGGHRTCNRPERVNNLMQDLTPKTRMQLALATIKEQNQKEGSKGSVKVSSSLGGNPTNISIGSASESSKSEQNE